MISTLITLFILLAIFALIWWGVNRLALPEPFKTVILVIVGLVGLVWLYHVFAGGNVGSLKLN